MINISNLMLRDPAHLPHTPMHGAILTSGSAPCRFSRARGFTLLELMIVVAIIAILSSLAVASYLSYTRSSRRSDAYAALSQDQGILERCYALTFSYANVSTATAGCPAIPATSPSGYYSVALVSTSSTYTITATPVAGGPQASDTACPSFSVNNSGTKTPSPTSSNCWQQ